MEQKNKNLREAMTADEIQTAQADHYNMDDYFRRTLGKLTLEQKRRVQEFVNGLLPGGN